MKKKKNSLNDLLIIDSLVQLTSKAKQHMSDVTEVPAKSHTVSKDDWKKLYEGLAAPLDEDGMITRQRVRNEHAGNLQLGTRLNIAFKVKVDGVETETIEKWKAIVVTVLGDARYKVFYEDAPARQQLGIFEPLKKDSWWEILQGTEPAQHITI